MINNPEEYDEILGDCYWCQEPVIEHCIVGVHTGGMYNIAYNDGDVAHEACHSDSRK